MKRCLELGAEALTNVAPNPMVGSVIVHDGKIIGEGYHLLYGKEHAEVNAIASVENKELLKASTLYVNLEPCSHFGKTPPCADLIIKYQIPEVVIGSVDTNSLVAGQGIEKLEKAGIKVKIGVLVKECRELNKRFFTHHEKKRPYIILKWAQTSDGFIDHKRSAEQNEKPLQISNSESKKLLHQWRSEEQSIIVGTNTTLLDNPQLTVREVNGKNPLRITLDKWLRVPKHFHIFDKSTPTLIFTAEDAESEHNLEYIKIDFSKSVVKQILEQLYNRNIRSLLVEGGEQILNSFIEEGLWDEARVFVSEKKIMKGVNAPLILKEPEEKIDVSGDILKTYRNSSNS
ncbi:MAG: bifunctional diaminohydroxyphosphoribosylaminopyrimidine deaminase/5-amino-6-(5-phosphoribosylamino)uracil reductase RibD [Bacteroidota bacterium]|nr:bifunctional diaminohydroxyphosphoribosylaminopyrimidine deaminase/5-amino-6-(5-phosphoribosylamino)uracil reductase RibD [Bacteroidota bacterium]